VAPLDEEGAHGLFEPVGGGVGLRGAGRASRRDEAEEGNAS
jgi:hypothetical protein